MQCIFAYCKPDLSGDLRVVAFYATAVLVTLGLSFLARSRSIRVAAWLVAGAWALSLFSYVYLQIPRHYFIDVALNIGLAWQFRRMARSEIFPAPLYLLTLAQMAFVVGALAIGVSDPVIGFILNRFFEATLLYLAGCSVFRTYVRRRQAGAATRITDWQARFVVN